MNKVFCIFIILTSLKSLAQEVTTIKISGKDTELIYKVGNNKRIYQSYFGVKLSDDSYSDKRFEAYPAGGMEFEFEPAIRAVHADGNPSLELRYVKHKVLKKADNSIETDIFLIDQVYNTEVTLHYLAYAEQNVFKSWVTIKNAEKKDIVLTNYASSMLHFNADKYFLTQFHGDWAKEMTMQEQELTSGIKIIDSKLGTRANKYQAPHFFLTTGNKPSTEDTGELIAGTLAWTGNFKFSFEIDNRNNLHIATGINNYASEYHLKPNEIFETPAFIFTYSNSGKGLASRNLHAWARKFAVLDGEKGRYTLLNNWEATGFKFNQQKLVNLFDG
ncbi:MAG: glycoside hydrolase family 36 N-terminal domain-containing protein, partial [Pedobacter sp.]|uniref:glycoside hydrolase family 36 N-terminal domain-containing protein n=1 Tax=Pedobacter sp. TaxID=1411316 RepID=UPI00356878E1